MLLAHVAGVLLAQVVAMLLAPVVTVTGPCNGRVTGPCGGHVTGPYGVLVMVSDGCVVIGQCGGVLLACVESSCWMLFTCVAVWWQQVLGYVFTCMATFLLGFVGSVLLLSHCNCPV